MFSCHSIYSSGIISGLTQRKIRIISGSRSPRGLYSFPQHFQLHLSSKNTGIPCFRIPGLGFRNSGLLDFRHSFYYSFRRLAHWHELFNAALLEKTEGILFKRYYPTFWSQCCGNCPYRRVNITRKQPSWNRKHGRHCLCHSDLGIPCSVGTPSRDTQNNESVKYHRLGQVKSSIILLKNHLSSYESLS